MSQILQVLSIEPVAQYSPVNSNYVLDISPTCSSNICIHSPVLVSHTIAVRSKEPVKILSPSALKCNETISPVWPFKVAISLAVSTSHNFAY